jgi:hypothetical protein
LVRRSEKPQVKEGAMFAHASFRPASRVIPIVAARFLICGLLAGFAGGNTPAPTAGGETAGIPDFAADPGVSWSLEGRLDDLLSPASGPGPVSFDPAHPFHPGTDYRVADLGNPILQPWARAQMKKANDELLAGKVPFRARERCWPVGVPGFVTYSPVAAFYFIQAPKVVTIINAGGPEIRQVYMNVPHSENLKPSWYGESVGHYEGGDTLVIDTIGLNERTFIDNYRTPHTTKLHVVERLKLTDGGNAVEISLTVDDPGAFTTAWSATQRWTRVDRGPIGENLCNENNGDILHRYNVPNPTADKPDF